MPSSGIGAHPDQTDPRIGGLNRDNLHLGSAQLDNAVAVAIAVAMSKAPMPPGIGPGKPVHPFAVTVEEPVAVSATHRRGLFIVRECDPTRSTVHTGRYKCCRELDS